MGLVVLAAVPARSEISALTVQAAKDVGPFRGKAYREIEAQLQGTAPGGTYSVPVSLDFPKQAADHNGFAIVDVINTVTIGSKVIPGGGGPIKVARRLGDDFLFGNGDAYVSVNWDQHAVEVLGNGTIASPTDSWTILRDVATLARNPSKFLPAGEGGAPTSGKIIAYGYSQSGEVLRAWYRNHLNRQTGSNIFDGSLIGGAMGSCWVMEKRDDISCEGALDDGGKVIALITETDAEWGGDAERGETPNYRSVEIAGVSHIPALVRDWRKDGDPTQNPPSYAPPFRAALVNLQEWLKGREAPPSVAIELSEAPKELECCGTVREAVRDADGNAKGGVRLPHMTSVLADGTKAGAPLGQYTGLNRDFGRKQNVYFLIGGAFKPFPPEKVKALYPTHAAYVAAVTASADDLVKRRHILQEDADAYIEAATHSEIGQP
jgi:hypothetical protein